MISDVYDPDNLDDALYDNYAVEAEYERLLERSFNFLNEQDQRRVIERIEAMEEIPG